MLILHIFAFSVPSIIIGIVGILYAKNGMLSVVDIRNRRKCWRLEVTVVRHRYMYNTVLLCRFLSRWKHVDDQSEQRVGVVMSVLRFAIALRPSHNMTTTRRRFTSGVRVSPGSLTRACRHVYLLYRNKRARASCVPVQWFLLQLWL